ncbi:MAG: endonuclease III [Eubacterium sp.]|jgi:endonuclease-3|nr:endonuclease III [Eubacterium sp.]
MITVGLKQKKKAAYLIAALKELYPQVYCELNFKEPHELLIATRLSAQCTDKRVNLVTPILFSRYKTIADFAKADIAEIEKIIKSCGLFKTKSKDIVFMCQILVSDYDEKVPDDIEDLLKLPGIGRKTANLIMGELYKKPAIVTDTHVIRLSNRLGLSAGKNAHKIEKALLKLIPPSESLDFCHRLVWYGRQICTAKSPKCGECVISKYCINLSKNKTELLYKNL